MSRILVVDDDPATLEIARAALELAGFEVVTTQRGEEAAELAASEEVAAVVLDVQLPGSTGFEVLGELRAQASTLPVPVLFLSARSASADRVEGLRAGANDYLGKPFDPSELAVRVERLVEQAGQDRALRGRIESFAVSELLQHLAETRKSGLLIVGGERRVGRFVFAGGTLRSASLGRLTGREATLAALELEGGRFEFMNRPVAAPTAGWQPSVVDLPAVLLEAAWLADELTARRAFAPAPGVPIVRTPRPGDLARVEGRAAAAQLPDLPFAAVLERLDGDGSWTEEALVEALRFAPRRIRLALAVLAELDREP